jgi:hypothetical protein
MTSNFGNNPGPKKGNDFLNVVIDLAKTFIENIGKTLQAEPGLENPSPAETKKEDEYQKAIARDPSRPQSHYPPFERCKFEPLTSARFSLEKQDCNPAGNTHARTCVQRWERLQSVEPAAIKSLTAEDLNNVGCAYLWLELPQFEDANKRFLEACDKKPVAEVKRVIESNLEFLK